MIKCGEEEQLYFVNLRIPSSPLPHPMHPPCWETQHLIRAESTLLVASPATFPPEHSSLILL